MSLPVYFAADVANYLQYIKSRNQSNEGYSEWKEYVDWIVHHLSASSIAFDYAEECECDEYGVIFFDKLGYSLEYIVKIDNETSQAYVLIIQMDFNLGRFGLVENMRRKGTLIVSESRLRKIISESIRKVLYN